MPSAVFWCPLFTFEKSQKGETENGLILARFAVQKPKVTRQSCLTREPTVPAPVTHCQAVEFRQREFILLFDFDFARVG